MGSFFELQIIEDCTNRIKPSDIINIQARLDQIESELSLYQPDSPINKLNRDGSLRPAGPHMLALMGPSFEVFKNTVGAFDISIWPALQLIQNSFKKSKQPPRPQELNKLKEAVDATSIKVENDNITFTKNNMGISLDGIAKGYAVDLVAKILQDLGFKNYLLNFSGNMRWQGHRLDKTPWRIVVWNPISHSSLPVKILGSGAIASSGSENTFFSDDKKWHHIIDPKTLRPPNHWAQTSVSGPSAMICDALSTALFVLPKQEILRVLKAHYPGYSAWSITPQNKVTNY